MKSIKGITSKSPEKKAVKKKTTDSVTAIIETLGVQIRAKRLEKNDMSVLELARLSGISYITIAHIEKGKSANVSLGVLQAIAKALGFKFNCSLT